jgi:hypothetical protein
MTRWKARQAEGGPQHARQLRPGAGRDGMYDPRAMPRATWKRGNFETFRVAPGETHAPASGGVRPRQETRIGRRSRCGTASFGGGMWTLEKIVDLLDQYHQRATYGAVGGVLGVPPRSVMGGRIRCHRYLWVVNVKSELPTDYTAGERHPALFERSNVLSSTEELEAWLRHPR